MLKLDVSFKCPTVLNILRMGRYCWERVIAIGMMSVCLSRPGTDSRPGEIDTPGLHHMIVSYEVIWCHWVRSFLSNEGIKKGYLPLDILILPLLAHLAWRRLQIDTDLLLIITSTADELSSTTNIDELERPWTPKIGVFSGFLTILGCDTHFKSELL